VSVTARRMVRALIVLAAVLFLAARYFHLSLFAASSDSAARESQPNQLHMGSVTLRPCEIGRRGVGRVGTAEAYCTDFDVPEDWDTPTGRHIQLRVAIVRSTAAHSQGDLVTYLAGGPGGAATEEYPALASAFAPLRQRRDILLVDQRGTGASNALSCAPSADEVQDIADSRQLTQNCLTKVRQHAAPEYYTTTDATRDLEAVRQALGAPLLNLYGVSYGTRLAQQYAGRYPAAVRSVALDSVLPNPLVLGSEHARNLEQALRALFALCTFDDQCKQNFGDTYATLYRLRDRLRTHPERLSLRDPNNYEPLQLELNAQDLVAIVRLYAYSGVTASLLPLMLHEADQGNYAPLLSQKKLLSDSLGVQISGGMELSVICTEDADLLTPQPDDANTLLGDSFQTRLKAACSVWPKGKRPADFHRPWVSSLPVLILAGQYDPVTPPAYAEQVLQSLSQARVLLAAGQGHGVLAAGCMPRLVSEFFDEPDPTKLNALCLEALGDTPAFVDFNGAPP
jgi:pimeloyl-ACP methyl ester carboxylesterase